MYSAKAFAFDTRLNLFLTPLLEAESLFSVIYPTRLGASNSLYFQLIDAQRQFNFAF